MKENYKELLLALRAKKSNVDIHKHSAFQIVFTEDCPFQTTLENNEYINIFGFVIKPQIAHSCLCSQSNLIVVNIEPYSFLGKLILAKLVDKNAVVFYNKEAFQQFFDIQNDEFSIRILVNPNKHISEIELVDERIRQSLSFIHEYFKTENISTSNIANHVFLSSSRLATLFKKQVGSSISKYLLWVRLRNCIYLILTEKDKTLTDIALESGFYDSSQMNKYMYQMFGVSPSRLKLKSDLIQFLDVEAN